MCQHALTGQQRKMFHCSLAVHLIVSLQNYRQEKPGFISFIAAQQPTCYCSGLKSFTCYNHYRGNAKWHFLLLFPLLHFDTQIIVWLQMKGNYVALHWPASSFENHGIKSSHDGSHNTAWADANLAISFKSWLKTESIYSISIGFLPWGCLKNWDTIPVCKPCLHVIAPEPQNLNTCMCVCSHNRAYWPKSHGKSRSGLAHRRGRIFQFNYAWGCNFTLTCGLLEIALLSW